MTWEGYNYEDAVLISERLVKEDSIIHQFISKNMNAKQEILN